MSNKKKTTIKLERLDGKKRDYKRRDSGTGVFL